jgi:ABC-type transporter Mla subunit MlaD
LGKELEQPMTRLIETASETPKAAAEVIEKLRIEISNNIERDNDLLAERKEMMEQLASLSSSLNAASTQQRDAVDQLVTTSTTMLSEVGIQFTAHVDGELGKISEVADQFASNAIEMASMGESFNTAVQLYSDSNAQLIEHLNQIEQSMDKANIRSEEQMGYYVAQAREIIDHSLLAQKEVVEKMRQLSSTS